MKCLENLSLVDDELVDDLQKDIAKLVNTYANIDKKCVELFKELKEAKAFRTHDIKNICNIIVKHDENECRMETVFMGEPELVRWSRLDKLARFFDFSEPEDVLCELLHLINLNNTRVGSPITEPLDFENDNYFMYRDGTNWELWLDSEENFLWYIEECIPFFENTEFFLELYKQLKEIEERDH